MTSVCVRFYYLSHVYFEAQRKQITFRCLTNTEVGWWDRDGVVVIEDTSTETVRASERKREREIPVVCGVRSAGPAVWRLWLGCLSPSSLRQRLCKGTAQPGQAGAIYSAALQSTHWWRASRVCARRRIKGSIPAMRVNKGRSEREGEAQKEPVCVCVCVVIHIRPS